MIYQILLVLAFLILRTCALFFPKPRFFLQTRKHGYQELKKILGTTNKLPIIWLHAASAGEAQQASDLAGFLRGKSVYRHGKAKIILSITSISVKLPISRSQTLFTTKHFDKIFYLPLDMPWHWSLLTKQKNSIRYFVAMTWDLWPNLIAALKRSQVQVFLFSAAFANENWKYRLPGIRTLLQFRFRHLDGIATVSKLDTIVARSILPEKNHIPIHTVGDSRYSAIVKKSKQRPPATLIRCLASSQPQRIFFASTYLADEKIFLPVLPRLFENFPQLSVWIFPHQVHKQRIQELQQQCQDINLRTQMFHSIIKKRTQNKKPQAHKLQATILQASNNVTSNDVASKLQATKLQANRLQATMLQASNNVASNDVASKQATMLQATMLQASCEQPTKLQANIIIVDQIGLLAHAYRYCICSYIGGGFHHRVHNTAEAAVYGKVVFSGPRISASPIARELQQKGYLHVCQNSEQLYSRILQLLKKKDVWHKRAASIRRIITQKKSASQLFYQTFLR